MSAVSFAQRVQRGVARRMHKFIGKMNVRYTYRTKWVNTDEVSVQFRKALAYLKETVGAEQNGDYLEFGVCHGTSMICMNKELADAGLTTVRLFGFDSFEGLPADVEGEWRKGDFNSDMEYTKQLMTEGGIDWSRTFLLKGWFKETCTDTTIKEHALAKVSIAMIDCDIYSGAVEALTFLAPILADTSIIVFDDWNPLAKENKGEKRAFDEFLATHPEFSAEEFGTYSYEPPDQNGKLFLLKRTHK